MRFGGCQGHRGESHWNCDVKKPRKDSPGHCGLGDGGWNWKGGEDLAQDQGS